jgi:hypothetical protein
MIRPLLDPVVAAKVHFVKHPDLQNHIAKANLKQCYGGDDTYERVFIPAPSATAEEQPSQDQVNAETAWVEKTVHYMEQVQAFLHGKSATATYAERQAAHRERQALEQDLTSAWRARAAFAPKTQYHRAGIIDDQGNITWPQK